MTARSDTRVCVHALGQLGVDGVELVPFEELADLLGRGHVTVLNVLEDARVELVRKIY